MRQRHTMLNLMLEQLGVEKERCRLDYVSAGEGEKFSRVIGEMVETVRALGPLLLAPEDCRQDSGMMS
jgi:F420-non-reducing hydrogenase iron-sulfur subunit